MKLLDGRELAGYVKEKQARAVRGLRARGVRPKLAIIRDSENPVIAKYVELKRQYGEDIGVEVEDWLREDVAEAVREANDDATVHGVIVQLPLKNMENVDGILREIASEKDVDGLARIYHEENNGGNGYAVGDIRKPVFESATATAVNWLLAGYNVDLGEKKIAIVGRGRLVGAPLERMWRDSGYDVTVFRSGDSLEGLAEYDVIVSATGVAKLIKSEMVGRGAVVVDAGTASEGGVLVGDVDDDVRERKDLAAITPKVGGVGPLTVAALFEHVVRAAEAS